MISFRRLQPWLFSAPLLLGIALTFAWPITQLARYSLQRVGSGYIPSRFVGLDNFRAVFADPLFWRALKNNALLLVSVPILVVLGTILAVALFEQRRGARIYRALLFLPYVLAIPVIGIVFGYLFQKHGLINSSLESVGLGGAARDWLGSSSWALWTIMSVVIWKELGLGVIVFHARLLSIPDEMLEASRIDGAGWWQRLWYVLVPQLSPAILFFVVLEVITMISWVFAYVYVMTSGGPGNSTVVSEYYIYQQTFQSSLVGLGAAAAVALLGFVLVLIAARLWLVRKVEGFGFET